MTVRRALVVDDSRSARAFLTRILERYELAVDGVESAEQAIDYLTRQRPDVIFMDHLMPGMDGFQAVQAIKNNPLTATIPIMMYTSQEGELYLSQARALGAFGVLPKQTKHTDVSKVLEQLRLIGEPRTEAPQIDYPEVFADAQAQTVRTRTASPAAAATAGDAMSEDTADFDMERLGASTLPSGPPAGAAAGRRGERRGAERPNLPAMPPELRAIVEAMVTHHIRNLQRFIAENFEMQADRVVGDVRLMLKDQPATGAPTPVVEPGIPERRSGGLWWGVLGGVLALLALWQWQQQRLENATLAARLAQAQQELRLAHASASAAPAAAAATGPAVPAPVQSAPARSPEDLMVEQVPFGELPLAGARLERIQSLLMRLNMQGFRGEVDIRAIPGRFCMLSGSGAMPMLAGDTVPFAKCDQVGAAREDNGSISARQSVAFANMIAAMRESSSGRLDIQISGGNPDETAMPYPAVSDGLTAGEWNRAAAVNNRVEVHWQSSR